MTAVMSHAEKLYILDGVAANLRVDGRGRDDFRPFTLDTTSTFPNTNGSARMQLSGGTDVVVGVKLEVGAPLAGTPDQGRLEFAVECSALASPSFEARGGEKLGIEISQLLRRMSSHPGACNVKSLAIISGEKVWVVKVDVLVLECVGGNLIDTIVMACALLQTKVPAIDLTGDGENEPFDFDVRPDQRTAAYLEAGGFPIMLTYAQLGPHVIVDATPSEEAGVNGRLHVAVTPKGTICSMQKTGHGGVSPAALLDLIRRSQVIVAGVITALDAAVEEARRAC